MGGSCVFERTAWYHVSDACNLPGGADASCVHAFFSNAFKFTVLIIPRRTLKIYSLSFTVPPSTAIAAVHSAARAEVAADAAVADTVVVAAACLALAVAVVDGGRKPAGKAALCAVPSLLHAEAVRRVAAPM